MANKIQVVCEWCEKEYELTPFLFKRSKHHFCSRSCSAKWHTHKVKTVCTFCGAELSLTQSAYQRSEQHFCSHSCYGEWLTKDDTDRPKATCEYCRGEYVVSHLSQYEKLDHHFCSRACYYAWKKEEVPKVKAVCEYCGKEYEAWPSHINRTPHNFCSHSCSTKWRSENECGENHPLWNRLEQECAQCGKTLWMTPSQVKRSENFFCSEECRAMWWSENLSGENHPCWQGGKSFEPYPPEFNEAFKQKIRTRDDHSCAICKLFGNNVHHINYVKDDTIPSNCITLCYSCHAATNHNRDYWQTELGRLMIVRQHHYYEAM